MNRNRLRRTMATVLSRGGGAAFSPLSLSPAQWFDFSDISSLFQDAARTTPVTADGEKIGGIADKSGNGKHASQATDGNRQTYKTSVQNGKSAVLCDGVANHRYAHNLTLGAKACTLFFAISMDAQAGYRGIYSSDGDGSANETNVFSKMSANNWGTYGAGADRPANSNIQSAGWKLLTVSRVAAGTGTFYLNGVADGTFTNSQGQSSTGHLGGGLGYSQEIAGYVGEVLVFSRTLSDVERMSVEAYLTSKWDF